MSHLATQLKWLIGIRLIVITSVALPAFLFQLSTKGMVAYERLYLLAGFTYLASLFYIGLLRFLRGHLELHAYTQFVGDLLLITALVYESGGISSPFSMLYLIVISVAATLLRKKAGLNVARLAWLLYAGLLITIYVSARENGTLQSVDTWRLVYNLLVHALGFYSVARLTSYLAQNVTRAERAEQELVVKSRNLAELEMFHRDVIESIASGLITTNLDGRVMTVNRAGRLILGRTDAELIGELVYETGLLSEPTWQRLRHVSAEAGRAREEVLVQRGDELLYIGFSVSGLVDEEGELQGLILIFQDLTDWRRLQEEVQLKERMAAVGELAAGLAHEIGNPLAAISGSVQMLSRSSSAKPAEQRLLEIVLEESRRLDRTIKSFLRYARPRDPSNVRFDVAERLRQNVELLRNSEEVTAEHGFELEIDPPSAFIIGDPDQISQIFWNLARNSVRAMPDGGLLRVTGSLDGDIYRITFIDTGHGMSQEERSSLFDPFKSAFDGGAGIGMAIVYRIVEEHRGRILIDSEKNRGTKITVELPALDPASIEVAVSK